MLSHLELAYPFLLLFCCFCIFALLKSAILCRGDDEDELLVLSRSPTRKVINALLSKCKVSTLTFFTCTKCLPVNHLLGLVLVFNELFFFDKQYLTNFLMVRSANLPYFTILFFKFYE